MNGLIALILLAAAPTADDPQYRWMFTPEDASGYLAHAIPDTDGVHIALECRKGGSEVGVTAFSPSAPAADAKLVISAGENRADLAGTVEADYATDGALVQAPANLGEDVFEAFRKSGSLTVEANGDPAQTYGSLVPAEQADIEAFFKFCAG